jgi:hypothetical protein
VDQDGYWLASVTDSHGTRELAREIDYDDALAEISDEIALRADLNRRQLDDAFDRIDRTPDCQEFDDLKVGGKLYALVEIGPEVDRLTAPVPSRAGSPHRSVGTRVGKIRENRHRGQRDHRRCHCRCHLIRPP